MTNNDKKVMVKTILKTYMNKYRYMTLYFDLAIKKPHCSIILYIKNQKGTHK